MPVHHCLKVTYWCSTFQNSIFFKFLIQWLSVTGFSENKYTNPIIPSSPERGTLEPPADLSFVFPLRTECQNQRKFCPVPLLTLIQTVTWIRRYGPLHRCFPFVQVFQIILISSGLCYTMSNTLFILLLLCFGSERCYRIVNCIVWASRVEKVTAVWHFLRNRKS